MDKNLLRLEFDKILSKLSNEASSQDAKKYIMEIKPFNNIDNVKTILKQTYDAYTLCIRIGNPPFSGIIPIINIIARAKAGSVLSCSEILDVLSTLQAMRKIKEWRSSFEDIITSIDEKFDNITINNYLEKKIKNAIISSDQVSDNASQALYDIRRKIKLLNQKIRERMEKMITSNTYRKYLMEPVITVRSSRFVIPVKVEHRSSINGLVHDVSSSGSTLFIEPIGVVEDNNQINELKNKEKIEIEKILFSLTKEIANFADSIMVSYNEIIDLDVIFAKAFLAFKMKASLPQINDVGVVNLKKARHPLIPNKDVKPIDIELGENFDTLVITGPNTGGKTVSIKTIGLMCLMAMSGLMIPANDGSKIAVFDNILVDIGDEQSIEQSVSTFSSHMKNIINILKNARDKTLVLIDEIGAGTDPEEGAALAISVLNALREKHCKIAVTTHYKELKEYAVSTNEVQCASCEFDIEKMKPTYKLLIGSVGSSNAFKISKKLGIDDKIIRNAELILGEEKNRLNEFLDNIEKMRCDLEHKKESIDKLYSEAKELKEIVAKEKEKLELERDRILDEARFKAKNIFESVRIESKNIIDELKEIKNKNSFSAEDRRNIKSKLSSIENTVDPIKEENKDKNNSDFHEGDTVLISGFEKEGVVASKEDSSGNFLVIIGNIKTKVSKSKLSHSSKKAKKTKTYNSFGFKRNLNRSSNMELDLRGKTVLDAIPELEIFLDNSLISGINQVTIIHGKGTGVLRKEVHNTLKKNKHVKDFRLGNFGEGEDGVTIANLK